MIYFSTAVVFLLLPLSAHQQVYLSSGYGGDASTYWRKLYNSVYFFQHSQHHHHHEQSQSRSPYGFRQSSAHNKFTTIEDGSCELSEEIDYIGLVAWLAFCLVVLAVGVWAGVTRSRRERDREFTQEQMILAGRDINLGVGVLTMAATWVGGGFIIGAAQGVYTRGLVWTHAPVFYSLSLVVGGTLFAKKMRDAKYFTMIDPFTQKYGKWGSVLVIPAAISEIIWCAAILSSLGSTIYIILGVEDTYSIYIAAILSLSYTLCGGLISVAYTDVVQIMFVIFGLSLALPFSMSHPAVSSIFADQGDTQPDWLGSVQHHEWGVWLDTALLCLLGGVPWQSYFQRVLSAQTGMRSVILSCGGALIALALCVPALMFGAVARHTDWAVTRYGQCHGAPDTNAAKFVLPLCLKHLTPPAVSWIGVGVISAAVMSSADSSLLSSSALIARNIWAKLVRPGCGEKEILRVLWSFTLINCGLATLLALEYKSVYELYFSLRLLVGDQYLGIPRVISLGMLHTPCPTVMDPQMMCEGEMPFRTIIMLIGMVLHLIASWFFYFVFCLAGLDLKWDILGCFQRTSDTGQVVLKNSAQLDTPGKTLENALMKQSKYLKKLERDNFM